MRHSEDGVDRRRCWRCLRPTARIAVTDPGAVVRTYTRVCSNCRLHAGPRRGVIREAGHKDYRRRPFAEAIQVELPAGFDLDEPLRVCIGWIVDHFADLVSGNRRRRHQNGNEDAIADIDGFTHEPSPEVEQSANALSVGNRAQLVGLRKYWAKSQSLPRPDTKVCLKEMVYPNAADCDRQLRVDNGSRLLLKGVRENLIRNRVEAHDDRVGRRTHFYLVTGRRGETEVR